MKSFITGTALLAVALLASTAQAHPHGSKGGSGPHPNSNFKQFGNGSHGTHFSKGVYYRGRNHFHWSRSYYWSDYGCTCYWDSNESCWYYWCAPRDSYLPVSCIQYAPPTGVAPVDAASPGDMPPPVSVP